MFQSKFIINLSAEKKKTFYDELIHNIFNKMQVDVSDLVV